MNKLFPNVNTQKFKMYASFALMVILCAIFENLFALWAAPGQIRLYLLAAMSITSGMVMDHVPAGSFGLFCGILADVYAPAYPGFNCIVMMLTALCVSLLVSRLMRGTLLTYMIISAVCLVGYVGLYWLFFVVFRKLEGGFATVFSIYLPNAIFTFIAGIAVYTIARFIKKVFADKPEFN